MLIFSVGKDGVSHRTSRKFSYSWKNCQKPSRAENPQSLAEIELKYMASQCWTVAAILAFGHTRMFGSDKLRPLASGLRP